jgi:hypothetical protein
MAEVFVAAAMGEEAQARGLAEALQALGFDAFAGAPDENDVADIAASALCVIALWPGETGAPWLTALAVLAQQRNTLINAALDDAAPPAAVSAAPLINLAPRQRVAFKSNFEALIADLERRTSTPAKGDPFETMSRARAALLQPARPARRASSWRLPTWRPIGPLPWRTIGAGALTVALLFAIGFGAGRVLREMRSGAVLVATPTAAAAPAANEIAPPAPAEMNWRALERGDWRAAAQALGDADEIKRRAAVGDARAQTMACLGHLAGAEGFLPSPTAARAYCDAASAQNEPAGLYLSWVLQRAAPHAGLSAQEAQARLAEAARRGWGAARIDYAQTLAPDARAPLEAQAEAGRLWLAAAEAGDARGQYFYARWLRDSRAGPRDPAAAAPYLERAAQNGQVEATHMLATLYRDGIGVARDEGRAKALYEQAVRQNHAPSMFNLAGMLSNGSQQDRARAVGLYKALACMRDELQIRPLAAQRLRTLRERADCR